MKSCCVKLASPWLIGVAVTLAITHAAVLAQQGPPAVPERPDPFAELRERRQRETALRGAEMVPRRRGEDPRRAQIIIEQMREDYKRLQVLRNEMVRSLVSGAPLDYKRVLERTAEINKRASRLKTSLAFENPTADDKRQTQSELNGEQIKSALVDLCNGIITFIENPMFKSPGVVDAQESTRAGRVLYSIIDLSDDIRRNAAKLRKAN